MYKTTNDQNSVRSVTLLLSILNSSNKNSVLCPEYNACNHLLAIFSVIISRIG